MLPNLNDLEIPSVVWDMPICDEECQKEERHVLLDIYGSLGGKNWIHKWDIDANGTAFNASLHCNWHGILCDSRTKHIMEIYLSYNNVRGELLVNVSNVQFLLSFSIGYNPIRGKFDNIVASMPKYLVNLEMSNSQISGKIPNDIVKNVPILSQLKLSGSLVSGEIPETIGDLVHLGYLNLGETNIRGSIPQSISRLKNLWYLDLETLRLKGNLSFLYNLRKLRRLHLFSNQISGPIPEFIGESCPNLTELRLPKNKLNGNLPRSLGMLNKLEILNVEKNNLSGPLPAYLFKLNLKVLVLSSNKFTRFEYCSSNSFRHLHIFRASHLAAFNCSLDTIVSYLKGSEKMIMQMDVSHSNIYGQIPVSIFLFRRLTILRLASNMLTGQIPTPWQNLPYFTVLDLQDNDLSGPIPKTFSRLLMLTELNLRGNKRLQGPVSSSFMVLDYQMKIKEEQSYTCPMVRFAHNNGTIYVDSSYYNRKYCYCDKKYFGNGIHCTSCLQGGSCPGIPIPVSALNELAADETQLPASAMFLKQGYFPFPRDSYVKSIHKCPLPSYKDRICVPEKSCGCYLNVTEEKIGISRSYVATLSRKRIYCNTSCLCRQGHHGRYCSQCIKGYYKDGIHCYKCSSKFKATLTLVLNIVGIIVAFLIPVLLYAWKQKYWMVAFLVEIVFLDVSVYLDWNTPFLSNVILVFLYLASFILFESCATLFESATFYLQVINALISTTDIWPQEIEFVQAIIISAFDFHFESLACSVPVQSNPLAKFVMLILAPVFCIGMVWLAHFALVRRERLRCKCVSSNIFNELRTKFNVNKCKKYSLHILDFAYFPIAESCIPVLIPCEKIDGISFLTEFPWINCSSSEYRRLFGIAVFLMLYVLIYSAVLCFFFWSIAENQDNAASQYESISENNTTDDVEWHSSILAQYTPKYRPAKQLYSMLRRLSIAFVIVWLPSYPSLLTSISTILIFFFIFTQAIFRPYQSPTMKIPSQKEYFGLENLIDILMLIAMGISIVCAEMSTGTKGWVRITLRVFIITTNLLFILTLCCSVLYRCGYYLPEKVKRISLLCYEHLSQSRSRLLAQKEDFKPEALRRMNSDHGGTASYA